MSYRLLDSGDFQKLEQVGPYRFVRPSPSATWKPQRSAAEWKKIDARFERYSDGDGEWKIKNPRVREPWFIDIAGLKMKMKLTSFGHLGIFAEQARNWTQLTEVIESRRARGAAKGTSSDGDTPSAAQPLRVLNLFAYTGGSSLVCAKAGAEVAHVDASKGSVTWARENAEASGLASRPIRWLVDDVQDFVGRELRRGNKYHGIILDPPSYGRGPNKQVWKIEEHLTPFLEKLARLLDEDYLFVLLSCHSSGYTPTSLENQLKQMLGDAGGTRGVRYLPSEMLIDSEAGLPLPSGCSCLAVREG